MKFPEVTSVIQMGLAAALLFNSNGWAAGKCGGDSAQFHIMPKIIGRPGEIFKTPYALPCDSMVVPVGQTTTIHAASLVHFGPNPSIESRIVVRGTLLVEGKADNPTYISGSVKNTELGYVPGTQVWDGIEVDSGAVVRLNHARIFNAPTPMLVFSKDMVLQDCYFQGGSGLILLEKNIVLNTQGHTIPRLDLRSGFQPDPAGAKNEDRPSQAKDQNLGKPKSVYYTAAGVALLAAAGLAWFVMDESTGKKPQDANMLDPDPELPNPTPLKP